MKKTHTYYTQIQFGLHVLNLQLGKLIVYYNVKKNNDEGVLVYNVKRDDQFLSKLLPTLTLNYYKYVLPFLKNNEKDLLKNKMFQ